MWDGALCPGAEEGGDARFCSTGYSPSRAGDDGRFGEKGLEAGGEHGYIHGAMIVPRNVGGLVDWVDGCERAGSHRAITDSIWKGGWRCVCV